MTTTPDPTQDSFESQLPHILGNCSPDHACVYGDYSDQAIERNVLQAHHQAVTEAVREARLDEVERAKYAIMVDGVKTIKYLNPRIAELAQLSPTTEGEKHGNV